MVGPRAVAHSAPPPLIRHCPRVLKGVEPHQQN